MKNSPGNSVLLERYRNGDTEAFDQLIMNNMGLVRSSAKRFMGRGTDIDDLIQIGSVGLIKAANAFDPSLGYEFSTYAFSMIVGELRRHFRDDGMLKISRTVKAVCAKILKLREEYFVIHGEEPSMSYLAECCGIPDDEVFYYIGALSPVGSLNNACDDERKIEDIIGFDFMEEFTEKYALKEAVACLEKEERILIHLRYDLCLTQQETAKRLGITQVKVSRTEKKIMEKLRKSLL